MLLDGFKSINIGFNVITHTKCMEGAVSCRIVAESPGALVTTANLSSENMVTTNCNRLTVSQGRCYRRGGGRFERTTEATLKLGIAEGFVCGFRGNYEIRGSRELYWIFKATRVEGVIQA